jgi:ABC-type nitrate/sulfonate/bicarbonate transport system permease component
VFGEFVGAKAGLGYLMTRAIAQFQTDRVIAAIALLSLMGIGLFGLVALVEKLVLPWRRFVVESGTDR